MKTTLNGINSKLDNTEEWISNLKDNVVEIEQQNEKKKYFKNVGSLRKL